MFPNAFKDRMHQQLGDEFNAFVDVHQTKSKTSIRLNPFKKNKSTYTHTVPWCTNGYYLTERPNFTLDPSFHAGAYYVQEASSMLLEQVILWLGLDQKPLKALDLCAAPGGKSTHLISLLHKQSFLLCNELLPKRFQILKENMKKWGTPNVFLSNYPVEKFNPLKDYFDLLLIDAPCSGEGLFRKNPASIKEWTLAHSKACAIRQQKIVESSVNLLAPGGIIIYSTCTYNPAENIDILSRLVERHSLETIYLDKLTEYGATKINNGLSQGIQVYPHQLEGEGFFVGVLQKKMDPLKSVPDYKRKNTPGTSWSNRMFPDLTNLVDHQTHKGIYSMPEGIYLDFLFLQRHLPYIEPVLKIGEQKGNDLVPDHALALSHLPLDYPILNLDYHESLVYLRGESLPTKGIHKGWHTVSFKGNNLGWIKVLERRINNYYPAPYRIKHL